MLFLGVLGVLGVLGGYLKGIEQLDFILKTFRRKGV